MTLHNSHSEVSRQEHIVGPGLANAVYDPDMVGGKQKSAKSISAEENDELRALMVEVMQARYGGNQTRLAEALGVSQGMVSDFLARKKGAGVTLLRAIERIASSTNMATALRRGMSDPCPSRLVVVELARGEGYPEHLLSALAADAPPIQGQDPGADYWSKRLRELDTMRKKLAADRSGPSK